MLGGLLTGGAQHQLVGAIPSWRKDPRRLFGVAKREESYDLVDNVGEYVGDDGVCWRWCIPHGDADCAGDSACIVLMRW